MDEPKTTEPGEGNQAEVQPGHLVHGRSLLGTWKGHRTPTEEFGDLPGILVTILDQPLLSGESREGLNLHVHGWGT